MLKMCWPLGELSLSPSDTEQVRIVVPVAASSVTATGETGTLVKTCNMNAMPELNEQTNKQRNKSLNDNSATLPHINAI